MRRLPLYLFILGFCFFLGSVLDAGYYLCNRFASRFWCASIQCSEPVAQFGKLSDVGEFHKKFVIDNTGNRPLLISNVKPSCGACIKIISFPKSPIASGEQGVVEVALLTKQLPQGPVSNGVVVFSNDPKKPVFVLKLEAVIKKSVVAADGHENDLK
jgi:Protein of unknown function (DUF1573)